MQPVKVPTSKLISKLKENRATHDHEYKEAMVGYRAAVIAQCEAQLAAACEYKDVDRLDWPERPREYLRSYDRAIAMCEAAVEQEIVLNATDFARYMMDEWDWSESFKGATSSYSNR